MAKVKLFSLLDRKLREFGAVHVESNVESMERSLVTGVRGSGSLVEKYPLDYDLYCVAQFDTETGEVLVVNAPVLVVNVHDLLERFPLAGG